MHSWHSWHQCEIIAGCLNFSKISIKLWCKISVADISWSMWLVSYVILLDHSLLWATWFAADMMKGSFYANPILDVPTTELSHVERYWLKLPPFWWVKTNNKHHFLGYWVIDSLTDRYASFMPSSLSQILREFDVCLFSYFYLFLNHKSIKS